MSILIPIGLIIFSLIFYFGRFDNSNLSNELRAKSINAVYSITSIVSSPFGLIKNGLESIYEIKNLYEENQKFKDMQIAQYESLLNASNDIEYDFRTSRIVGVFSNNFNGTLIVNSGKEENIKLDMPVSGSNGIIGRISHVGERLSRVLLISNINSRIPVIISEDGYHGMLVGQGRKNPIIEFVEHIEKISIGDLVTTSGKGGIFPPFQLIGQVVGKKSNEIEISIFENIATLSHVKLLNYKLIKEN